jgi:hypothetical protein
MRRMVFGSVSTTVLHHSGRPVLVVPQALAPAGVEPSVLVEQAEA